MIQVNLTDIYSPKHIFLWCLLSFKSGLINTAGFLITGSFVSHITGFGTQIGMAIGHHEYEFSAELLVIPFAFIFGAIITSLLLDKNYDANKVPNYPLVQLIITLLLGLISILFSIRAFRMTSPEHNITTILETGLLCLVCGLKNSLSTWSTYGKIRTTHITGLSTDIGLHFFKLLPLKKQLSRYPEPAKVNQVRIIMLLSFSLGACLSALLIPIIKYKIFYLAFLFSLGLLFFSTIHRRRILYGMNAFKKEEQV